MKPKIICIIPAFFPDILALTDLLHQLSPLSVVVVDNTPEKGATVESQLRKQRMKLPKHARLLRSGSNLGYTGGSNLGLHYGYERGFDWMVILNDDLTINRATARKLQEELEGLPAGIAGVFPRFLEPRRWSTRITPPERHTAEQFDYLSGSILAIHRSTILTVGYLYEPYFAYYEDVEYCIRAQQAGISLTQIHLPGVIHHESSGLGKGSALHRYYLARNHMVFVERNAPLRVRLHELLRLPKTVYEYMSSRDQASLTGIGDYLLRRFGRKDNL